MGTRASWKEFLQSKRGGCSIIGVVVIAFFADLLFGPGNRIVANDHTDVWRQFAGWRLFGFSQIREGNFPLWNPLVYGGTPYFSGFQSALLYPPNWICVILPLAKAINWVVAFHVWWLGSGTFLWLRSMSRTQTAALFGGVVAMLSAPHFLHIYAGHLTNLCVMAWVPWLLLVVRLWRLEMRPVLVLAGGFVVAMQILAGHPQYVYYTAIISSLYAGLLLFTPEKRRVVFLAGFAAMFAMSAVLVAVQLLPGFEATKETIRSATTSKAFSGSYSFPPENLLTMLVPPIFGDMKEVYYWGRWFLWEMSAFIGVTTLCCWVAGAAWAQGERESRIVLSMGVIGVVLAFGSYTPLFHVLYAVLPGFDLFRGNSKFMFFAMLFLVALSALGLDRLIGGKTLSRERLYLAGGGVAAGLCAVFAMIIAAQSAAWKGVRQWIWETGAVPPEFGATYFTEDFQAAASSVASRGFWIAAIILGIVTLCVAMRRKWSLAPQLLVVVGIIEVMTFAAGYRKSFKLADLMPDPQLELRASTPGDYRGLDLTRTNGGMLTNIPDIWGDDPGALRRYAEFVATSLSRHPDHANQHLVEEVVREAAREGGGLPLPARWDLLRLQYVFNLSANGTEIVGPPAVPLNRFELVPRYHVVPDRDQRLRTILADRGANPAGEAFDPRAVVVLEENPGLTSTVPPGNGPVNGVIRIDSQDTDDVRFQVEVDRPCILLMTDPYSNGWRVVSLASKAPQSEYRLLPANHCLRAIPLEAGTHFLRVFYRPTSLVTGIIVSGLAWAAWIGAFVWLRRREKEGNAPSFP